MATQEVRSMVSETSICNQALSWVGANRITSLEDPSVEAEWCRDNYPFLRDAVLEENLWSFATVKLSKTSNDPDDWENRWKFVIPLDWIKVFRVYDNPDKYYHDVDQVDWEVNSKREVIADCQTIYMIGVKRVTDTGLFTPLFVQALAARLAVDMAIPMTENRNLQADMQNLYNSKMDRALSSDGQQARRLKVTRGNLARRIHTGSRY